MDDFEFGDELTFEWPPPLEHGGGYFAFHCEKCGYIGTCCWFCLRDGEVDCDCDGKPKIKILGFYP